ncbi:MAG TPA: DUF4395 family protein [Acidimicrobiales bacterium]
MTSTSGPAPIDPRGPRTNQAVLATGLLLGLAFGQEWVAPLFAVVLFLGAAFGPSYGPVLRLYRDVIRPRLAPPSEMEDPRPPRFAASVGVTVLTAATVAFLVGATVLGWALVVLVAALAALSALTGLCVGCEMYVMLVRLRGGSGRPNRLAPLPDELLREQARWVVFSTQYCAVCPSVVAEIERERPGERVVVLDVAEHLDLAARYKVRRAPTVLRVDAGGAVLARLSGVDAVRRELVATAVV